MAKNNYRILAIETSCDETAAAVIHITYGIKHITRIEILSDIVSSQVRLHAKYGGVYPELASREHVKNIMPVIEQALLESNSKFKAQILNQIQNSKLKKIHNTKYKILDTIDTIAVTTGPGLIGSLLVGVETAKTLAYVLNKPIYPINHVEGHIYANFIRENSKLKVQSSKLPNFPLIALVVSGGHTSLIYMKNHLKYKVIGETLDDAAGEAFDKVAKMLGSGYPGGPIVAKMAEKVISNKAVSNNALILNTSEQSERLRPTAIKFPRPMIDSRNFDFSFSGLKTSVLYTLKKLPKPLPSNLRHLVCKEFQDAVVETLVAKTIRAAEKYEVKSILLCGGVAANSRLREEFKSKIKNLKSKIDFFVPQKNLCTDNAAMIGTVAAYKIALCKKPTPWYNVNAQANLKL